MVEKHCKLLLYFIYDRRKILFAVYFVKSFVRFLNVKQFSKHSILFNFLAFRNVHTGFIKVECYNCYGYGNKDFKKNVKNIILSLRKPANHILYTKNIQIFVHVLV